MCSEMRGWSRRESTGAKRDSASSGISLEEAARWIHEVTTIWDQRLLRLKAFVEEDDPGA